MLNIVHKKGGKNSHLETNANTRGYDVNHFRDSCKMIFKKQGFNFCGAPATYSPHALLIRQPLHPHVVHTVLVVRKGMYPRI